MPLAFAVNDKGILPDRMIATLAADGVILSSQPLVPDQIQPASLDLRLAD
ncbi:MAG: 2'-deoxycytidine 5'-triphosphate deaminase, partial [Alphaproteobacteria bacterium]